MKIATYRRVSSEDQAREGTSLQVQREILEKYAKNKNWEIYHPEPKKDYVDDGYSGSTLERPALKKLLKDAKLKKFEAILVYKIDRFARNNRILLNLIEEFENAGIGFISATESFDTVSASGKMALSMLGTVAQFERDRIIERVFPGMIKGVERGHWQGSRYTPYGYKYNKKDKILEIIPEEAEIVKLIFMMYLSNQSTKKIAGYLYQKQYKTRSGGQFHSKFVCDILKNKLYIGKIVWNKHSYDKKQRTRKGYKYVKNDPSKIIEADGKHKAIISSDDFYLVQEKLKRNRRGSLHRNTANDYPLTGILYCAECEHRYRGKFNTSNHRTGKKKRWYACNAKHEHNIDCSNPAIKAEEIEPYVFILLETLFTHPEIKDGRVTGLTTQNSIENDMNLKTEKDGLESNLKNNLFNQKKLYETYEAKLLAKEIYEDKAIDLRSIEQKLKIDIAKIHSQMIERERSEVYRRILERVLTEFNETKEELAPIEKKELLQLVIKRILIKDKKIVKLDLYQPFERYLKELKCDITQITTMALGNSYLLRPTAVR